MTRWIARISVCLLLGLFVTVAVAWISALTVNVYDGPRRNAFVGSPERMFEVTRWDAFGATRLYATFSRGVPGLAEQTGDPAELIPPYAADLRRPSEPYADEEVIGDRRWIEARGWPWRAVSCRGGRYVRRAEDTQSRPDEFAFELSMDPWTTPDGRMSTARVLPYKPIVQGVVLNTLLYGVLLYVLVFLPFDVRRELRRRRGQCLKCGYPLDEVQETCPECGRRWGDAARNADRGKTGPAPIDLDTIVKWIRRAAVCIVLGLLAGLAVAVACSLLVNVYEQQPRSATQITDFSSDRVTRYDAFGSTRIHFKHWRYPIGEVNITDAHIRLLPDYARDPRAVNSNLWHMLESERFVDARGWPFRAIVAEVDVSRSDPVYTDGIGVFSWTVPEGASKSSPAVIPYGVIWKGVLLNAIIYATAMYLIVFVPIDLLRRRRRKRSKEPVGPPAAA